MWRIESPLENRAGTLFFDGCDVAELANEYGTPLYAMSENRIRNNYRRLSGAFKKYYNNFRLYYAVKANNNLTVLNILRQEGCGADCSAPSEVFLALKAGFNKRDLLYTGNYNTDDELRYAAENNVVINLDDASLIEKLARVCSPSETAGICFRFNPGMGKGETAGVVCAGPEAKFGILESEIIRGYRRAKELGFKNFGIHMMTGSNVKEVEYFPEVAEAIFRVADRISREVGIEFSFINIGGGFGVPYKPGEPDLDIETVAKTVTEKFKEKFGSNGPRLLIEPGRYIVCDAGILLTRVHHVKRAEKIFVGTDAGMNTLLRPALYGSYHQIYVANKLNQPSSESVTITGQICENTDHLARDRELPTIAEGDVLAVLNTGAYGFGMSSQYNSRPRAAEVLVNNGQSEVIREREEFEDLIGRQEVPQRLLR
ncbi:diaminopimelate decarboxylase [Candidatus Micrarchaeota archaeon]|nr:diaminopimelate decarboxylase [Candidatus Micrarchaeota archaeon]